MDKTSSLAYGALSGMAGPMSLPFAAGYVLSELNNRASQELDWNDLEKGFMYGVGYWFAYWLMTKISAQ